MTAMHATPARPLFRPVAHAAQRGVALIFALITLVALLLATLALVRTVDTNALLIGNLGFKQDATAAADQGAQQAIAWLTANKYGLQSDVIASGYYASTQEYQADGVTPKPPLDATGGQLPDTATRQLIDWTGDGCRTQPQGSFGNCSLKPFTGATLDGNQISYVVLRQCSKAGDYQADTSIHCANYLGASSGGAANRGSRDYGHNGPDSQSATTPYFRILVRVAGARDTVSFTETIVHF